MKGKGVKKKRHFRFKRFIAIFLVLTFVCQMPTSSLVVSGIQSLFHLVTQSKAAMVDSPTVVRLNNAVNFPTLQQESGDVCVDDFVEFYDGGYDGRWHYVSYNVVLIT